MCNKCQQGHIHLNKQEGLEVDCEGKEKRIGNYLRYPFYSPWFPVIQGMLRPISVPKWKVVSTYMQADWDPYPQAAAGSVCNQVPSREELSNRRFCLLPLHQAQGHSCSDDPEPVKNFVCYSPVGLLNEKLIIYFFYSFYSLLLGEFLNKLPVPKPLAEHLFLGKLQFLVLTSIKPIHENNEKNYFTALIPHHSSRLKRSNFKLNTS